MKEKPDKILKILGVKVSSTSVKRVLRFVRTRLKEGNKFFITTPNPEQIVAAQKDSEFKNILNQADLALPDGVGLLAASKFLSLPNPKNIFRRILSLVAQGLGVGFSLLFDRNWVGSELTLIHGRKMFIELIDLANKKGWKVVLIGDRSKSAQKAVKVLRKNYKTIKLYALEGPDLDKNARCMKVQDKEIEKASISEINKIRPHLLFVGFGAPQQEKWADKWFKYLNVGGVMVVGGTFDYISGKKKLPPKFLEKLELEWLWRLYKDPRPKRLKRILNAASKFPWMVFEEKLYEGY